MILIGLDLAWSLANPSAAVALRWDGRTGRPILWADSLRSDEEILGFVAKGAKEGPALLATDAPLLVPNEKGARACDRKVSQFYRRAQALAYPANRKILGPVVRGEALVCKLERLGFRHSSQVERQKPVRQVVEVFPHPAAVELFGLPRILQYKARPGRPYELRWQELRRYQDLLGTLAESEPAMKANQLLGQDPRGLRGTKLKALEDLLDALFCAYIALHLWYWGPAGYRCFGNEKEGYILVPVRPNPG